MKNRRDWKAPVNAGALPLMGAGDSSVATAERDGQSERRFALVPGSPVARGWWPYVTEVSESELRLRGLCPDEAIRRGAITEIK